MNTEELKNKFKRNELGLLESIEYKFTPENRVDWKALVPAEFLYPNPQNKERLSKKYNKPYIELNPIEDKIEDADLILKLAGIRFLLNIRGYNSISYRPIVANESYAATVCKIVFEPNFESFGKEISFEDIGSASLATTKGFGQLYLSELSANRAFCRCVRAFLNINIVSNIEVLENFIEEQPQSSDNLINQKLKEQLSKLMIEKSYTFEEIKAKLIKKDPAAEKYTKIEDLPIEKIVSVIEKLKNKKS